MEYDIKLTQQELHLIMQSLGELPLKVTINLFGKLQQEIVRQDQEKAIPIEDVVSQVGA